MFKLKVSYKDTDNARKYKLSIIDMLKTAKLYSIARDIENVRLATGLTKGKIELSAITTLLYSYDDNSLVFVSVNPMAILANGAKYLCRDKQFKCLTNATYSDNIKTWWNRCGVHVDSNGYVLEIGCIRKNFTFTFLGKSVVNYLVLDDCKRVNCRIIPEHKNNDKTKIAISYWETGNVGSIMPQKYADYNIEPRIDLTRLSSVA